MMTTDFTLSLIDAEDLVVASGFSDHDMLVLPLPLLVSRGVERDLVVPLRRTWVGSSKPISARWADVIGLLGLRDVEEIAAATGHDLAIVRARLNRSSLHALPRGSTARNQVELARRVHNDSLRLGIQGAAKAHAIRPQESALYARRYRRVLAELARDGVAATDAIVSARWPEFEVTPENMKRPWTPSPAEMWSLPAPRGTR